MANSEEFCSSIAEQLSNFLKQIEAEHALIVGPLEEEIIVLRSRLRGSRNGHHARTPRSPCAQCAETLQGKSQLTCLSTLPTVASTSVDLGNGRVGKMSDLRYASQDSVQSFVNDGETIVTSQTSLSRLSMFSGSVSNIPVEGPLANWCKLVVPMSNMSLLGVRRARLESALVLRTTWNTTKHEVAGDHSRSSGWLLSKAAATATKFLDEDLNAGTRTSNRSRCIMHPDSKRIFAWIVLGVIALLYDVLSFPLAGFDIEYTQFSLSIMSITTLYWTADIGFNLLRGVHYNGYVEMRPFQIFLHYARTWLAVDAFLVALDWLVLYSSFVEDSEVSGGSQFLQSGKAFRVIRIIRAVRLGRSFKVLHILREVFENMKSDYLQLFLKLGISVLCMLLLSHYVTCGWFALAHFNKADSVTWITTSLGDNPRPSFYIEYVTSMHFSLTQIAGSQDIVPQNGRERLVASIIIVFDIVVFSTLVGTITDIMAEFRSLHYGRNKEVSLIRQFFARTDMKPSIENRIWRFFRTHYRSKSTFITEHDIAFFDVLPPSLRMDMDDYLYVPIISTHALFKQIVASDRYAILAVCGTALTSVAVAAEAEVFTEGVQAKWMFFVITGHLMYTAQQFNYRAKLDAKSWISEVVLWTKWMHCGHLVAELDSVLLRVDAEAFEQTMLFVAESSSLFRNMKKYAALFAQRMSDSFDTLRPMTDIDDNNWSPLATIVQQAFSTMDEASTITDKSGHEKISPPPSSGTWDPIRPWLMMGSAVKCSCGMNEVERYIFLLEVVSCSPNAFSKYSD